jgi:hypothetical protein
MYVPFDWEGYCGTHSINEYIKNLSDNELVLVTDTYDVLPLNGCNKNLIEKKIRDKFDLTKVVFGAETNCFPDGHLSALYPDHIPYSKWKFLNGGGYFGTVKLLKYIIGETLSSIKGSMNQRVFTNFFLNHPEYITLDYTCEVFQTLFNGRVHADMNIDDFIFSDNTIINKTFNTIPFLFHGNGGTNISPLRKYIN